MLLLFIQLRAQSLSRPDQLSLACGWYGPGDASRPLTFQSEPLDAYFHVIRSRSRASTSLQNNILLTPQSVCAAGLIRAAEMSPVGLRTFLNKVRKQTARPQTFVQTRSRHLAMLCSRSKFYLCQIGERSERVSAAITSIPLFPQQYYNLPGGRVYLTAQWCFYDRILFVLDSICQQKAGRFRYRCSLVAVTNPAERLRPPSASPGLFAVMQAFLFFFFLRFQI